MDGNPPMKSMTVGDLRRAIVDVNDEIPVVLELAPREGWDDHLQASLRLASVEQRCDEKDVLYLFGDQEEDDADLEDEND